MSGIQNAFGFMRSAGKVTGSQSYTSAGTYSWVAPTGVTSVSAVAVGAGGPSGNGCGASCAGGGGGSGGSLAYLNNYSVTPGNSYTVIVGASIYPSTATYSSFVNISTLKAGAPGGTSVGTATYLGGGGGGGCGTSRPFAGGGGGAGGYSGAGGSGG